MHQGRVTISKEDMGTFLHNFQNLEPAENNAVSKLIKENPKTKK